MYVPSLSTLISVVFLAYVANSVWSLIKLFIPPTCEVASSSSSECLKSQIEIRDDLNLILFTTTKSRILNDASFDSRDFKFLKAVYLDSVFKERNLNLKVPLSKRITHNNGSMFLAIFSVPGTHKFNEKDQNSDLTEKWFKIIDAEPERTFTIVPFTQHKVPEAQTFNLLNGDEQTKTDKVNNDRPVTHIRSKITVSIMTDFVRMSNRQVPAELYYFLRLSTKSPYVYLPIVYIDELSLRLRDLKVVNKTDIETPVEIQYKPIGYGKLRLFLQFTLALSSMKGLGFTEKDTDEVKGIFADTNIVLLSVTFSVSAIHLLFDFLAFKNDISFWRSKKSMTGLSTTTVIWRAFSQSVVFLYLMDENTSLLVLIPSGIGAIIEIWKVTKAFKVQISFSGIKFDKEEKTVGEKTTLSYDGDAMRYLSFVLYPLVIGGAVYSLLYVPHKSWWSWTIQSTVNGVYAFGFLFMLPQLFVNYKLKSVAHLPWRSFMYKAFNTFIDDLFAFIITMPTAHRVACFRDDIVFLIYLYQRYLYPVDSSRLDSSCLMEEDDNQRLLTTDKKTD